MLEGLLAFLVGAAVAYLIVRSCGWLPLIGLLCVTSVVEAYNGIAVHNGSGSYAFVGYLYNGTHHPSWMIIAPGSTLSADCDTPGAGTAVTLEQYSDGNFTTIVGTQGAVTRDWPYSSYTYEVSGFQTPPPPLYAGCFWVTNDSRLWEDFVFFGDATHVVTNSSGSAFHLAMPAKTGERICISNFPWASISWIGNQEDAGVATFSAQAGQNPPTTQPTRPGDLTNAPPGRIPEIVGTNSTPTDRANAIAATISDAAQQQRTDIQQLITVTSNAFDASGIIRELEEVRTNSTGSSGLGQWFTNEVDNASNGGTLSNSITGVGFIGTNMLGGSWSTSGVPSLWNFAMRTNVSGSTVNVSWNPRRLSIWNLAPWVRTCILFAFALFMVWENFHNFTEAVGILLHAPGGGRSIVRTLIQIVILMPAALMLVLGTIGAAAYAVSTGIASAYGYSTVPWATAIVAALSGPWGDHITEAVSLVDAWVPIAEMISIWIACAIGNVLMKAAAYFGAVLIRFSL